MEARIRPVTMADADGARIYRRSLTFLLEAAFVRRFPGALLFIDHSLASGGYFCNVRGRRAVDARRAEGPGGGDAAARGAGSAVRRPRSSRSRRRSPSSRAGNDLDKARLMRHRSKPTIDALPARRLRRLPSRLHGALHRVSAVVRAGGDGRRLCAPLPAPARAHQARADGRLPEAARRVLPVRRLAGAAGHLERGRARRRHPGGPQPGDHPRFGGPARTAHRGDRPPDRRPPAARRGWC